ncbi:hypothetical protein EVAR_86070_1 [Eumeta japonica]|uniref:Uncharacterized protein n=1 Tax=Eumeta variegata TaxID=151549 RepID=A0A4C1UKE2_EUMVA|nr:hypothetical protein EVAR_86070_1 [Eumeta japonica]
MSTVFVRPFNSVVAEASEQTTLWRQHRSSIKQSIKSAGAQLRGHRPPAATVGAALAANRGLSFTRYKLAGLVPSSGHPTLIKQIIAERAPLVDVLSNYCESRNDHGLEQPTKRV